MAHLKREIDMSKFRHYKRNNGLAFYILPINDAAEARGALFSYLAQVATHRNPRMSSDLVRSYCALHRHAAAQAGFRLP